MATYSLGSDDSELARLEAQADFIHLPSLTLLRAAGIEPGSRVLDLGTGLGHVAVAVAELVGDTGRVVAVDRDPRMLEGARARTAGLPQVEVVEGDVTQWRDPEPFDAVVGRLVFFHLPDPVATLRHHLGALRPGGRLVVLDYDMGGIRTEPPAPFADSVIELVMTAFRAGGADPTIGSRLQVMLADAGASNVGGMAISQYVADAAFAAMMLGGVVQSLSPLIVGHGLASADDVEPGRLVPRIAESVREAGAVVVPPVLAGAWGRR